MNQFERAIKTIQQMRVQKSNDYHISDKDKRELQEALNYINAYFDSTLDTI